MSLVRTHFVLPKPDPLMACVISVYSGGERRVETNFHRFCFLGSIGLPTLGALLMSYFRFKKKIVPRNIAMIMTMAVTVVLFVSI